MDVHQRLPEVAAFSCTTAGWLHGLDLPAVDPIEVTVFSRHCVSTRACATVHREALEPSEIVLRAGLRTTNALQPRPTSAAGFPSLMR